MKKFIIGVLCTISLSVSAAPVVYGEQVRFEYKVEEPELVWTKPFDTTLQLKHYDDGRKAKMYWYAINALDVYTTYTGLRQNENLYEANPALPNRPSLSQLVLHKAVMFSFYNRYFKFTHSDYRHLNVVLTAVVVNNHSLYN
tara:strand:+ start:26390 stop:26815 length:426 start_codon:yes stop_codon:yes gene_type:complete